MQNVWKNLKGQSDRHHGSRTGLWRMGTDGPEGCGGRVSVVGPAGTNGRREQRTRRSC